MNLNEPAPNITHLQSMMALVVDDEEDVCRGLLLILKKRGIEVMAAYSAEEALEKLKLQAFDFLITDLNMPGIGGMELLREVKKCWPKTVVILITGYGTIEKTAEAMKLGAYHFITKPFNNDEIILTLERAAREKAMAEEPASILARRSSAKPSPMTPP